MPRKLNSTEIELGLKDIHPDWQLNTAADHIIRTFHFQDYYQTMAFTNAVAWIAHQQDHHPELLIGYKTCQVDYSTHSANGLSSLDFYCAALIDQLSNKK